MSPSTTACRLAVFGAGALLGLSFLSGAASAAPQGDRTADTAYTEDNDTNDEGTPNNVVDDGDNLHPSGQDRSVEHGGSGNQGKATSDPDDDGRGPERTNGGADKPNGPGGRDAADQDGNNGCGNDDDFEDDNEGWCGKRSSVEPAQAKRAERVEPATTPMPVPSTPSSTEVDAAATLATGHEPASLAPAVALAAGRAEVLGVSFTAPPALRPAAASASAAAPGRPTQVLGVTYERGSAAALARTGTASTLILALGGAVLLALGLGLTRAANRRPAVRPLATR